MILSTFRELLEVFGLLPSIKLFMSAIIMIYLVRKILQLFGVIEGPWDDDDVAEGYEEQPRESFLEQIERSTKEQREQNDRHF
jgi:hypothetical protein